MHGASCQSLYLFCLVWVVIVPSALAAEPVRAAGQGTGPLGKVAYVQGGDLWVKALPDGPPRRLTTDMDVSYPTWSPSGQWLTFMTLAGSREQALWVVSATEEGAKPFKLARGWISAWFPTQDVLAYQGAEDGFVRALDPEHGRDWVILKQDDKLKGWSLSPDGRWIAYITEVLQPEGEVDTLWRIQVGGGRARRLVRREGQIIPVGWSRDGKHILFGSTYGPCVACLHDSMPLTAVTAAGGKVRTLLPAVRPYDDFVTNSPDGTYMAVASGSEHLHLLVLPLGSGKAHALTDQGVVALSPRWSSDGQWIAYVAAPDVGDESIWHRRRVWVAQPEKRRTSQLTWDEDYEDESPLWSADGRHILFLRLNKDARVSLWLMRSDGTEQRRVVDGLSLEGSKIHLSSTSGLLVYEVVDRLSLEVYDPGGLPDPLATLVVGKEIFDWWRGPKAKPWPRGQTKARR